MSICRYLYTLYQSNAGIVEKIFSMCLRQHIFAECWSSCLAQYLWTTEVKHASAGSASGWVSVRQSSADVNTIALTLYAQGFFVGVAPEGGQVSIPLHNSFVYKVRLPKFCTELIWDKMNILRQRESGSN